MRRLLGGACFVLAMIVNLTLGISNHQPYWPVIIPFCVVALLGCMILFAPGGRK